MMMSRVSASIWIGPRGLSIFPALQQRHGLVAIDLALQLLDRMHDRGHAVVTGDGHEVGRRIRAVFLFPGRDELRVHRIVEVGVVMMACVMRPSALCPIGCSLVSCVMSPGPISLMPASFMPSAA